MKLFIYVIGILLLLSGCEEIDRSKDKIAPLPDAVSNSIINQIEFIDEVIEDEPEVADYYYRRAILYLENKQRVPAKQDIEQAIRLEAYQGKYFFVQAQIYDLEKKPTLALKSAEEALNKGFREVDLYLLLAKLYYSDKQPIKTVEFISKVEELLPKKPEVFYYRGLISADVKDTIHAVVFFNKALIYKPDYTEAYLALVKVYNSVGKYETAISYLQKGMVQSSMKKNAVFHYLYGDALFQLKEKTAAMDWYQKAVTLDSTLWQVSHQLALYYVDKENYRNAEIYLKKALRVNPNIQGGHYMLGVIYDNHLKNYVAAKEQYEKALAKVPQNEDIQKAVQRMERKIAYDEYKKSPQYILDQLRKRKQEELEKQQQEFQQQNP